MTTIKTASNATAIMQAVLPRSVTPLDIARRDECTIMNVMRSDFLVGDVLSIANLAGGGFFEQEVALNQAIKGASSELGRDTLTFADDKSSYYEFTTAANYAVPFSMVAVFKADSFGTTGSIFGGESATTASRVGLSISTTNKVRARMGSGVAQSTSNLVAGTWYAAIMSSDGGSEISLELLGESVATASDGTSVTRTNLEMGSSNSSFGFDGQIDMTAMFDVELHDAANAALLSDVKSMLAQFYGTAVTGL